MKNSPASDQALQKYNQEQIKAVLQACKTEDIIELDAQLNILKGLGAINWGEIIESEGEFLGATPLHFAAVNANQGLISLLVENGLNIDIQISVGKLKGATPLDFATAKGHHEIIALLKEKGAAIESEQSLVSQITKTLQELTLKQQTQTSDVAVQNVGIQTDARQVELVAQIAQPDPLNLAALIAEARVTQAVANANPELRSELLNDIAAALAPLTAALLVDVRTASQTVATSLEAVNIAINPNEYQAQITALADKLKNLNNQAAVNEATALFTALKTAIDPKTKAETNTHIHVTVSENMIRTETQKTFQRDYGNEMQAQPINENRPSTASSTLDSFYKKFPDLGLKLGAGFNSPNGVLTEVFNTEWKRFSTPDGRKLNDTEVKDLIGGTIQVKEVGGTEYKPFDPKSSFFATVGQKQMQVVKNGKATEVVVHIDNHSIIVKDTGEKFNPLSHSHIVDKFVNLMVADHIAKNSGRGG